MTAKKAKPQIVYVNGRGSGKLDLRERMLFRYAGLRGYQCWSPRLDWDNTSEKADEKRVQQTAKLVKGLLEIGDRRKLAVVSIGKGNEIAEQAVEQLRGSEEIAPQELPPVIKLQDKHLGPGLVASSLLLPTLIQRQMNRLP